MKIMRFHFGHQAALLGCLLTAAPIQADESTSKTESKSQSGTTQVEVRVESSARKADDRSGEVQNNITLALGVAGDASDSIEAAIDKLEKQMKASGLPVEMQEKAIESLRSQLEKQADGKKRFSGKATWTSDQKSNSLDKNSGNTKKELESDEQSKKESTDSTNRFQMQFRQLNPMNPNQPPAMVQGFPPGMVQGFPGMAGANGMAFAFSGNGNPTPVFGPLQKEKLKNAISEALEQNGISAEVIERSLKNVDVALNELSLHAGLQSGARKPPYRIGVACMRKDKADTTPGMEIESIFEDSPAATVGLKPGDRLTAVDDKAIESHDDIVSAVQVAGEANRSVLLKATRDGVESVYEVKPTQTAVAEFNVEWNIPGFDVPSQGQAWVMPQLPQGGANLPEKIQEQYRDAMKAARNAMEESRNRAPKRALDNEATLNTKNEKNIDKLREELSNVHQDIEEIKGLLKKLNDKP